MPVTKSVRECYEVRDGKRGGEWANITLHCWDRRANVGTPHQGTYYCGEITNMPALADARNALAN